MPTRNDTPLRRGQIWWVDWDPSRGSEQHGRRPALVIQSNAANEVERYPNTIVLALSTSGRPDVPTHVEVAPSRANGLAETSFVKVEQIFTIARTRLDGYLGTLEPGLLAKVDAALGEVLGLSRP